MPFARELSARRWVVELVHYVPADPTGWLGFRIERGAISGGTRRHAWLLYCRRDDRRP